MPTRSLPRNPAQHPAADGAPERELMRAQGTNEIHIPARLPKDVAEGSDLVMTAMWAGRRQCSYRSGEHAVPRGGLRRGAGRRALGHDTGHNRDLTSRAGGGPATGSGPSRRRTATRSGAPSSAAPSAPPQGRERQYS
jgi:hypothetical protein